MQFGNKDIKKSHDLSSIIGLTDDKYVVRHYDTIKYKDGSIGEDPTSGRIQVYSKDDFARLSHQPVLKSVQQKSQFQELGLNVQVLHDPNEGVEGKAGAGSAAKPRKADEVIADINAATTAEEVDALIVGDTRKTVLAAAEAQKETFIQE